MMKGGIMYNQGDIVLVPFPFSDLSGAKLRPALIISNHDANKKEDRICALVTSQPNEEGIQLSDLSFSEGKLPFTSWVKPGRLFTIDQKIIKKKLGRLSKKTTSEITQNIADLIACA